MSLHIFKMIVLKEYFENDEKKKAPRRVLLFLIIIYASFFFFPVFGVSIKNILLPSNFGKLSG